SEIPIDAVGIQAHLSCASGPPFSAAILRRFLTEIAGLGLTIQITELDVTDENGPVGEAARDRLVADTYSRFLDAALDEPAGEEGRDGGFSRPPQLDRATRNLPVEVARRCVALTPPPI